MKRDGIKDSTYSWDAFRYGHGLDSVRLNFVRHGFHGARPPSHVVSDALRPSIQFHHPHLDNPPVRFIPGFFNESLPRAVAAAAAEEKQAAMEAAGGIAGGNAGGDAAHGGGDDGARRRRRRPPLPLPQDLSGPRRLAILRLDADSFEGTMDILTALYDLVSPGGFVIVDDFHLIGARQAVRQFRAQHKPLPITAPMLPVGEDFVISCRQGGFSRRPGSDNRDGNTAHDGGSSGGPGSSGPVPFHTYPDKPVQVMYWRVPVASKVNQQK